MNCLKMNIERAREYLSGKFVAEVVAGVGGIALR